VLSFVEIAMYDSSLLGSLSPGNVRENKNELKILPLRGRMTTKIGAGWRAFAR
jgi:hypothetical protein